MWFYLVPYMIGGLAAAPFVVLNFFPKLFIYVIVYLFVLSGILFWSLWEPSRFAKAFWPWLTIFIYWICGLIFYLFIDGDWYRFAFAFLIAIISAWYMYGWLISSSQLLEVNKGAGLVATLILTWFNIFFAAVAANGLLIYLNYSYWLLFSIYGLIIALLSLALGWVVGWRVKAHWPYLAVSLILQLQAFIVLNWLPINFYAIGWFLALLFFVVFMFSRFDTGLTISRRTLGYYLLSLVISSGILLITIRWF